MDIEELYKMIPNEATCRAFFEELIWPDGRVCPNCGYERSYRINGASTRSGLYECASCKRQFTVTTNTPMHSTKLPLFKWLLAIYYIINSSKGISSVYLARLIGVHQSTAWKMGHAIRKMMRMWGEKVIQLSGTIEMDEKYFGGKPRFQFGISRKPGTHNKRSILITVQRKGGVVPLHVEKVKNATIMPVIDQFADPKAKLMTDKHSVFHQVGKRFSSHQSVWHFANEYARGDVHVNTAESFGSMLERVKTGVFHYMSNEHLNRYLSELSFRWANRDPKETTTANGKKKTIWTPKPVLEQLKTLLTFSLGLKLHRSKKGGIVDINRSALQLI